MVGRGRLWSDEDRRHVAEMLLAGKSMGRIGRLMGLTRATVIGRVTRDGDLHAFVGMVIVQAKINRDRHVPSLPKSPVTPPLGPITTGLRNEPLVCHQTMPDASSVPDESHDIPVGRALIELSRNDCRWPVAEADVVGGQLFCGAQRVGDWTPYCGRHHRIAHPGRAAP